MHRFRLLVFAMPLLLLTLACGNTATPTADTSDSGGSSTTPTATTGSATATDASTQVSGNSDASGTPDASASPPAGSLSFTLAPTQSEASYRATEQLAGVSSPSDAVGKTRDVSGTIVFDADGAVVSNASKITINLATLTSDQSRRDNYIKQNTLKTDQYPNAVFVPTAVSGLTWPLPASGQATFTITGDMTAHGVTAPTTWDATATFDGSTISGSATTEVKFEDFGMSAPRTMLVLSVEDHLTFTLNFVFTPAN